MNSTTGLVVLASDDVSRTYYHAEMALPSGPDTQPPSKPTATAAPGQVTVSWTQATHNVAVAGYRVLRDNAVIWETGRARRTRTHPSAPAPTPTPSRGLTAPETRRRATR